MFSTLFILINVTTRHVSAPADLKESIISNVNVLTDPYDPAYEANTQSENSADECTSDDVKNSLRSDDSRCFIVYAKQLLDLLKRCQKCGLIVDTNTM